MIYAAVTDASDKKFQAVLSAASDLIRGNPAELGAFSSSDFEGFVCDKMILAAKGSEFENKIKRAGTNSFPDIIANRYFGVEVKMTIKDQWTSIGNSILESSRIEDIQRIYIMFGKFGGKFDVKFRLYQECLPEVSVTHSPRYKIDMNLASGESIFEKIGVAYDDLRMSPNPIAPVKDYYRALLKDGEELWWIDQDGEQAGVSPIIHQFRSLDVVDQRKFRIDSMILFPEIFGNGRTKFERAAAYLITEYNAVSSSLRDSFTAGGKVRIDLGTNKKKLPRIAGHLHGMAKDIEKRLSEIEEKKLMYYWRVKSIKKDRLAQWSELIPGKLSKNILSVFDAGLNAE